VALLLPPSSSLDDAVSAVGSFTPLSGEEIVLAAFSLLDFLTWVELLAVAPDAEAVGAKTRFPPLSSVSAC
jgi:hypothetical protein